MTSRKDDDRPSLLIHGAVLLAAAGVFAFIARGVKTKRIQPFDRSVRKAARRRRRKALDIAVRPVTVLSIPLVVASSTAALALWLYHEKRPAAALATAATPLVAAAAGQSFTMLLAQRSPPDVRRIPGRKVEAGFPSGHVTGVTAEALAISYILGREKLLSAPVLAGLMAWPVLVATTRVYRDRHWASDILAGLAAGTAVAAATTALYDATHGTRGVTLL
jgi:undecaprenyl-diphosphatase